MFSAYEFRISKKPIRFQILSSYPNTIRNRGLYFFQILRELLELSLFQPKKEFGMYLQKILWNYECLYLKLRQRQSEVVVKLTSNFLNSWFAYITLFTSTKLSTKSYKTFLKVKRLLYSIHFLIQRSFGMHLYNDIHIMAKSPVLGNEMQFIISNRINLIMICEISSSVSDYWLCKKYHEFKNSWNEFWR